MNAQQLVDTGIRAGAMVNTDGSPSLINLERVDVDYQVVSGDPDVCDRWLPWVHRFISNAKTWVNGTHHGVKYTHLARYLAEYTYRFNRRHDVSRLFHRAGCRLCLSLSLFECMHFADRHVIFDSKSNFNSHLPMLNRTIINIASRFYHLKPMHIFNRLGSFTDGVLNCLITLQRLSCLLIQYVCTRDHSYLSSCL